MNSKLGAAVGDAEAKNRGRMASYIPAGSPRNLIPQALVHALSALIDECPDVSSATRVELRTCRSRLCRLFKLNDPMGPANASDLAWEHEDEETPG